QLVGDLVLRHRVTRRRSENAVDWAVVIAQLRELRLDSLDRGISRRNTVITGFRVIVRLILCVVIVGVVVVSVIRQVIPRIESGIKPKPEAVVKDKEPIVEEMGMPPVPVAVPICVMTFSDVAHSASQR